MKMLFQDPVYLDIISVNVVQILISLANLAILYALLKKFLYKPVKNVIAARKAELDEHKHLSKPVGGKYSMTLIHVEGEQPWMALSPKPMASSMRPLPPRTSAARRSSPRPARRQPVSSARARSRPKWRRRRHRNPSAAISPRCPLPWLNSCWAAR